MFCPIRIQLKSFCNCFIQNKKSSIRLNEKWLKIFSVFLSEHKPYTKTTLLGLLWPVSDCIFLLLLFISFFYDENCLLNFLFLSDLRFPISFSSVCLCSFYFPRSLVPYELIERERSIFVEGLDWSGKVRKIHKEGDTERF